MARLPRFFIPDVPSHVMVRGNNHQDVFFGDSDRLTFLACLRDAAAMHGVSVHAYVLMSNHVHILATGAQPASLALTIQSIGRKYVPRFNRRVHRSGTLWEGRYRSMLVRSERYVLYCQRYIELNPVRAAMVSHPGQYVWSSYLHYAQGRPDDLIVPHAVFLALGSDPLERRKTYAGLFDREFPAETLAEIRSASRRGRVLGNPSLCVDLERLAGGQAIRRPRGRPRKRPATG